MLAQGTLSTLHEELSLWSIVFAQHVIALMAQHAHIVVLNKDFLQLLDGKGTQFRENIGASPSPGQ